MKNDDALVATPAIAAAACSIAIGNCAAVYACATPAINSIAIGNGATNFAQNSVVIGPCATNFDDFRQCSIAIGFCSSAAQCGTSIGACTYSALASIAIGLTAKAPSNYGIAIGHFSCAETSDNAIAIGCCSKAGAANGVAIGAGACATAAGAVAIGCAVVAATANTTTVANLQVIGQPTVTVDNTAIAVPAGTYTVNWNDGNIQVIELGGNITLALTNPRAGASYVLAIVQPISGVYTVTWPAGVQWSGGLAPTQTTAGAAKKTDVYTLVYLGTTQVGTTQYVGSATQNMF
jgi:hypothetical protein